ncbi:MAG: cytochrome c [Rhodocyclales bacterium]|nr:cytochrome c [Rhodocyclales bacterium]
MKTKTLMGAMVIAGAALSTVPVLAADPATNLLSAMCSGCHGTDGSSRGPTIPSIAGMNAEYFVDSMKAFRDGTRAATVMTRIAKGYTDQEIEAMAQYFAAQKLVRFPQSFDPKLAERGKRLHENYCEKCHEDGGMKSDEAGVLAGQMMPYLRFSLDDFLQGRREIDKKMKAKVDDLLAAEGKEGLEAVVHFYGSQHDK